jgi:hypothetical protein
MVKSDITVPRRFAVVVAALLGYRVAAYFWKKKSSAALRERAVKKSAVSA